MRTLRIMAPVPMLAAVLLVLACTGKRNKPEVRPGDSVFDLLSSGTLASFPATNLPPPVLEIARKPFLTRSGELGADQWVSAGTPPPRFRSAIQNARIRLWSARPALHRWEKDPSVMVYVDGAVHDRWKPGTPFPGWDVWWDEQAGSLYALSEEPPDRVSVGFTVDPDADLAPFEPVVFAGGADVLQPADLVRTVQLSRVSRRALFLPAPSALVLPVGRLRCDEMRVSVGLIDRAFRREGRMLMQDHGRSNGVVFALDVLASGHARRVWSRPLRTGDTDRWTPEESIDLRSYRGKLVTLRLMVEPGEGGDHQYDYAVWGTLRFSGPPARTSPRPHIVLIDLDTLRRDRLGCYGNPRGLTPRIDAWAHRSTVFADCVAAAPWTLPSTVSMLTGLSVHQHRVDRFPEVIAAPLTPLALMLSRGGYETVGIAEGGYVSGDFGFDMGFDTYDCTRFKDPRWDDVIQWLRTRRSERPVFLLLHTYMAHAPFPYDTRFEDPDRPYRSALRGRDIDYSTVIEPRNTDRLDLVDEDRRYIADLYDAQVCRLDELVGGFLASVDAVLEHEPHAVILTSDHGEELLEHGLLGHGQSLFRELLDVPLIIEFPDSAAAAGVDPRPVTALDLVPTILDLAGLEPAADMPGTSVRGRLSTDRPRIASQSEKVHALLSDSTKLISGRVISPLGTAARVQLYDLRADPAESRDLSVERRDLLRRLSALLAAYLRDHAPPPGPLPTRPWAGELRRLEALGYVRHDQPTSPVPEASSTPPQVLP